MTLATGDAAPDFRLPGDKGEIALADLKGRPVVLYFYPKDDTSGCTSEAQAFTAAADAFSSVGAVVIGVSKDSVASHAKFRAKYGLEPLLASDEAGEVVERYGVWVEKSMYGRKYMGIDRSTFLIDGDGRIARVWRKVKVPGHAAEVLAAAKAFGLGRRGLADLLFDDGYLAELYDLWHPRSLRDDYDFYLPHLLKAGAVLDVGCGTGGLLHDARARGHAGRLCGLDPAAAMIALARRCGDIDWVVGELPDQPWTGEFDLVVMTGHAFQTLVTEAEVRSFLAAARRVLAPGGRLLFETRNPTARAWERWRPENAVTIHDREGAPVRITTRVVGDFDGETLSFTHTFEGGHPGLPKVSHSTLRFTEAPTLRDLLNDAGFAIDAQFGAFDGSPFAPDSPELISFASAA